MHCILRYFNPGVFQNKIKVCLRLVYFVLNYVGPRVEKKEASGEEGEPPLQKRIPELVTTVGSWGSSPLGTFRGEDGLYSRLICSGPGSLFPVPSDQSWPWRALSLGWADSHRYLKGRGREALLWQIRDMLGSGGRMWSGHTLAQLVAAVEAGVKC